MGSNRNATPAYRNRAVALGCFWARALLLPVIVLIVVRALDEESVLVRDLEGYKEYTRKVRYSLVPTVW